MWPAWRLMPASFVSWVFHPETLTLDTKRQEGQGWGLGADSSKAPIQRPVLQGAVLPPPSLCGGWGKGKDLVALTPWTQRQELGTGFNREKSSSQYLLPEEGQRRQRGVY